VKIYPVTRDYTLDDIFLQLWLAELPRLPHVENDGQTISRGIIRLLSDYFQPLAESSLYFQPSAESSPWKYTQSPGMTPWTISSSSFGLQSFQGSPMLTNDGQTISRGRIRLLSAVG
jgi:hypothetical protein